MRTRSAWTVESSRMELSRVDASPLSQVVGGIAHEVRNALFGMSTMLDAMADRVGDHPDFSRYIPSLRQEVDRISRVMDLVVEYGSERPFVGRSFALIEAARTAAQQSSALAADHGVRMDVVESGPSPAAWFDPVLAAELLGHLIDNAIRQSPHAGTVTIAVGATAYGTATEAIVTDSGAGIAPDDLPHVFEPFFSHDSGGPDLGLAIVRRLIELHGGAIEVSNPPGGGAAFRLRFPTTAAPVAPLRHVPAGDDGR